jgi:hypothetical protein
VVIHRCADKGGVVPSLMMSRFPTPVVGGPPLQPGMPHGILLHTNGDVAELADAQHLGCCAARRESSSLSVLTMAESDARAFARASDVLKCLGGPAIQGHIKTFCYNLDSVRRLPP